MTSTLLPCRGFLDIILGCSQGCIHPAFLGKPIHLLTGTAPGTGRNVVKPPWREFIRKFRVRKKWSAHANKISLSFLKNLLAKHRFYPAHRDDRYRDYLFDLPGARYIHALPR